MHLRLVSLALLAAALPSVAHAQRAAVVAALPEHTIAYVAAPDIDASLAEMQNAPLLRMWREAEVQDFFAGALQMASKLWEEQLEKARAMHTEGVLPFSPDELMKLRVSSVVLALTSLDIADHDGEPMPRIGLLAHLDFGESAESWRKIIDHGLQLLEQHGQDKVKVERQEVAGVQVTRFVPPVSDMALHVAYVGNGVLVGSLQSEVHGVLERLQSKTSALSTAKNFTSTFAHLDRDGAEMEFFMQPGPVIDFVLEALAIAAAHEPDFPEELDIDGLRRALAALGVNSIRSVGSTWGYEADESTGASKALSKTFVYAPKDERKGLFAGASQELDLSFLKWVPKDIASFSAMTFDLRSIYDGLVGALQAYDEELANNLLGALAQYEEKFGIKLRDDLIASLGSEAISWQMPVAALGGPQEWALLLKVEDEERLLKMLRTIAEMSDGLFTLQQSDRRGMTVYQLEIEWDIGGGMGFNPFDMYIPTFSFKDGYLVAGFSTGDVKRVFKRMEREDDPAGDIRSNPEFEPYLELLPQGVGSISFTDWKASFEGYYQLLTGLAAFVPLGDEIPIDLSLLPDVSTLTKHLSGAVSWTTSSPDGYISTDLGPWGPETMALAGAAVSVGVGFAVSSFENGKFPFR